MPIRQLSQHVVNQIAAGEVIERPASVVKELVENSIDAGATQIDVAIEHGGRDLVRVTDNGAGIPFDELTLALSPHATSKIDDVGDLDAIATMGFRGEAIASIASVSRLTIRSRQRDADGAGEIEAEGERTGEPKPVAAPPGTTVTVRNLFFNTPARRRFMKSDRAETGRVAEMMRGLALAHPECGFSLTQDGKPRYEWAPSMPIRARVLAVLGQELATELLEVDGADHGITVWGLAGTPELARANTKHIHLFLNGRMITDRTIIHAVREGYRGLIEPSRAPTVALYLEVDPARVDVNVHPAKAEVRFRDGETVHRVVRRALKAALAEADLLPEITLPDHTAVPSRAGREFGSGMSAPAPAPSFAPRDGGSMSSGGSSSPPRTPAPLIETAGPRGFEYDAAESAMSGMTPPELPTYAPAPAEPSLPRLHAAQPYLQVHSSFIVTQDEHGLVIIDQHALHERVMFETLTARITAGPLESQRLLVPAVVETDGAADEAIELLAPLLAKLGIEAEPMGPRSLAVHAFTSLLFERKVDPVEFMQELLDHAAGSGFQPNTEAALHEVLDMMSCKAAIKAGDRLQPDEIAELLASRERIERASNCPHGRPTTLRLSIRELERRFGRS